VDASANIFAGSRFPGEVSYSKAYDSEGSYDVPGVANFVTHGNSDSFGVNWSENLPGAPTFSAAYQMGSSQYSVYGTSDQGNSAFHSVNLHSNYRALGFNMGAFFTAGNSNSLIPEVATGVANTKVDSDSDAVGFNLNHRLPFSGSMAASFTRSSFSTSSKGLSDSGSIDIVNALASIHPVEKISFSASASYSDNLAGQLIQSVVSSGGVVVEPNTNQSSNSLDLMAIAGYTPAPTLQTTAFFERRSQFYQGQSYGVNSFGGTAAYAHTVLNGSFNATLTLTGNQSDQSGADTVGFSAIGNYSNQVLGWQVNGSAGYAQNVQTLLVTDMNSFYNYSGSARRRWGQFNMSVGASAGRTALTQQAGTADSNENYNASAGFGQWISANGGYSKSSGQALDTGTGLVPVTGPVPPGLLSLYGGSGYSFGLSSTPVKHLILSASYSSANSDTTSNSVSSTNQSTELSSLVQYQYRKLNFTSGFARLQQGFSTSGTVPEVVSSYYFGVSRWFNFF